MSVDNTDDELVSTREQIETVKTYFQTDILSSSSSTSRTASTSAFSTISALPGVLTSSFKGHNTIESI